MRAALLALVVALLSVPPVAAAAEPTHLPLFTLEGKVEAGNIPVPPPEGELEDACGVAVDSEGDIYVADYFHHVVDVFGASGEYLTQIQDPDPDGPCNLAVDSQGDVYVDNWHRDVLRFAPSQYPPTRASSYGPPSVVDFPTATGARATGVFLDPANGDLYVDDRTYVSVYEAASLSEPEPEAASTIGLGLLGQGYGVAVSDFPATLGDIYVPDAAAGTVRIFDPSGMQVGAIAGLGTPQQGFASLLDSDVAVDQSDGHVFVADDTEPGFEAPAAAIDEFNSAGEFRGQLPGAFVDAGPSALAIDGNSHVFVTSGDTEGAVVEAFGPTQPAHRLEVQLRGTGEGSVTSQPAGISCGAACAAEYNAGEEVVLTAIPAPGSAFVAWTGCNRSAAGHCTVLFGTDHLVTAEFEPAASGAAEQSTQSAASAAALPVQGASAAAPSVATRRRSCRRRHRCHRPGGKTRRRKR